MSTGTENDNGHEASRRIDGNPGEMVCLAFTQAGLEPRNVTPNRLYAAKTKFAGFCPDCRTDVIAVTVRMLRGGNRNCACENHSLHGLDAHTSPPKKIAERIDKLGITREAELKAFSSTFVNALGTERLAAVIACSRHMKVIRKRPTQHMSREELLDLLGTMPDRASMLRDQLQAYRNYLGKGGTDEELNTIHSHLASKRREITETERDVKAVWRFFASKIKEDPRYSISDLQKDYPGAREVYETALRGVPLQLVFQNAARFHFRIRSPIHLPSKWVLDKEDRYMARLKVCARTARKAIAVDDHRVEFTAKHLDSKDGIIHLQSLVDAVVAKFAIHDGALRDALKAGSPGLVWDALSAGAKSERIREELLTRIGFPLTVLSHRERETQLQEVVAKATQLGITTNNAFREQCGPLYKFLRSNGRLDEFLTAMRWPGAYVATHAKIVCKSEFEAVLANILSLAKTPFRYDKTYPGQSGTSFRYDFFLKASSVYVEAYMFRCDSAKAKAGRHHIASGYVEKRHQKELFLGGAKLAVVRVELEDFYGKKDRSLFVHHAYRLLLKSGVLAVPLSPDDLLKCRDVHQSQVDPEEGEARLTRKLVALGLSDAAATAVVGRIKAGVSDNRIRLTQQDTFSGIAHVDAPTVFCGISRSNDAFAVRRMEKGVTIRERFSDFEHGHWTLALGAAIDLRDSSPSLRTRGKSLGKAPKTGVWHLRIRNKQVSVGKAAAKQDAAKVIAGNTLADKIRTALDMIAENQSEILLTEPFVDSATATDMERQFRIVRPTREDIDKLVPLIMERMKTADDIADGT